MTLWISALSSDFRAEGNEFSTFFEPNYIFLCILLKLFFIFYYWTLKKGKFYSFLPHNWPLDWHFFIVKFHE